jgi:hypothetical protein
MKSASDIEKLLSVFEATLLRQVFLQIGMMPNRKGRDGVRLTKEDWRLNGQRSVQYVQSRAQLEMVFWGEQQSRLGVQRQMDLHSEHRRSKSPLPSSVWRCERGA